MAHRDCKITVNNIVDPDFLIYEKYFRAFDDLFIFIFLDSQIRKRIIPFALHIKICKEKKALKEQFSLRINMIMVTIVDFV